MEVLEICVTLAPSEAAGIVKDALSQGGFAGTELLDSYTRRTADGREVTVRLFERYYVRSSNRATLTMVADNLDGNGKTRVRFSAGGGGNSLFWRFDWGAGESFAQEAANALKAYRA